MKNFSPVDRFLIGAQTFLQTCFATPSGTGRANPANTLPRDTLDAKTAKQSARLMRVNHVGEVCAQALYQGQALTSRNPAVKEKLARAAEEENDHLKWCSERLIELNSHRSYLNPVWYAGALGMGVAAGICGDEYNLGFLAETENQVVEHIDRHLGKLSPEDYRSAAILKQMRIDEQEHAQTALQAGASHLPWPIPQAMKWVSRVMTISAQYI
ncbi:MAG: demethoxyubiquinone hydroxylase family protein [Legionellales bacterium]|nr:demethoxyubiquinone hydroxylase family protein [Legionellales bacterium]|tara:strand:+ start:223 stop:861 length:639 start_codon:yes stop_codon:yes gene_type:complete